MSAALRALLTLAGVVAATGCALLAVTELSYAVQGAPRAAWIALLCAALAVVASWLAVWAARGANPFGRVVNGGAKPPARLRLARALLSIAALLLAFFALATPIPPSQVEALTAAMIVVMLVAAAYGAITITHPDGRGRKIVVALGAVAVVQILRSTHMLSRIVGNGNAGPAPAISFLLAWCCFGGLILAAICVLSLRGAWPPPVVSSE